MDGEIIITRYYSVKCQYHYVQHSSPGWNLGAWVAELQPPVILSRHLALGCCIGWRCSAEGQFATIFQSHNGRDSGRHLIGSRSRPPRHPLALCCSRFYQIQSSNACLALVRVVARGWSFKAPGMEDWCPPPFFSFSDGRDQTGLVQTLVLS